MKVFSIAEGFYWFSKQVPPEVSQKEFDRLRALMIYTEAKDAKWVCQKFGISIQAVTNAMRPVEKRMEEATQLHSKMMRLKTILKAGK